jgi:hypothetical protein
MNRYTGEVMWERESETGFPLVSVSNGRLYVYEGKLEGLYTGDNKERRGGIPVAGEQVYLRAIDLNTGVERWNQIAKTAASWLTYSDAHDVLLMSNKDGIEAIQGEDGSPLWNKSSSGEGFKGHPENYWDRVIVWKDQLLDQRGPGRAYNLLTGDPIKHVSSITGEASDWEFTKIGHHCNYAIANEHLMTFRADGAGFCDIVSGESSRLNGFRPGCRNSLIPANGVLNAPNYGHGCTCSYSLFTSLALTHVPESHYWTYSSHKIGNGRINRLGINFGAPGDRRATNGTMWLDYPNIGGPSPGVKVTLVGRGPKWFRFHPNQVSGEGLNWVAASGVQNVESVKVPLVIGDEVNDGPQLYTVRLHFAEPDNLEAGERVFGITVQGKPVFDEVDVVRETGAMRRSLVKEVSGVEVDRELQIDFSSAGATALLCGVEIVKE